MKESRRRPKRVRAAKTSVPTPANDENTHFQMIVSPPMSNTRAKSKAPLRVVTDLRTSKMKSKSRSSSASTNFKNTAITTTTTVIATSSFKQQHRALEKVKKLLAKNWSGWDSEVLAMDAKFLLRLAEGRSMLGKIDAPFEVPSLVRATLRPENAYSEAESERRVHCMVGEAILETLLLVTLKRLNVDAKLVARASDCKTRIVRCLSKHGFKRWSTLTAETESILRFKRGKRRAAGDLPQPMGVLTPKYRPDLNVTLHRSGSVDMTMLFDNQRNVLQERTVLAAEKDYKKEINENQENQDTQDNQDDQDNQDNQNNQNNQEDLAATNRRLMDENQKLQTERDRLLIGVERASEHILSAKKIKRRERSTSTSTSSTSKLKPSEFSPSSTKSILCSTDLNLTQTLRMTQTTQTEEEKDMEKSKQASLQILAQSVQSVVEEEERLGNVLNTAREEFEARLRSVEEETTRRVAEAASETTELQDQLSKQKETSELRRECIVKMESELCMCRRELATTVDQVAEARMTATKSLYDAEKRQEQALYAQELNLRKRMEIEKMNYVQEERAKNTKNTKNAKKKSGEELALDNKGKMIITPTGLIKQADIFSSQIESVCDLMRVDASSSSSSAAWRKKMESAREEMVQEMENMIKERVDMKEELELLRAKVNAASMELEASIVSKESIWKRAEASEESLSLLEREMAALNKTNTTLRDELFEEKSQRLAAASSEMKMVQRVKEIEEEVCQDQASKGEESQQQQKETEKLLRASLSSAEEELKQWKQWKEEEMSREQQETEMLRAELVSTKEELKQSKEAWEDWQQEENEDAERVEILEEELSLLRKEKEAWKREREREQQQQQQQQGQQQEEEEEEENEQQQEREEDCGMDAASRERMEWHRMRSHLEERLAAEASRRLELEERTETVERERAMERNDLEELMSEKEKKMMRMKGMIRDLQVRVMSAEERAGDTESALLEWKERNKKEMEVAREIAEQAVNAYEDLQKKNEEKEKERRNVQKITREKDMKERDNIMMRLKLEELEELEEELEEEEQEEEDEEAKEEKKKQEKKKNSLMEIMVVQIETKRVQIRQLQGEQLKFQAELIEEKESNETLRKEIIQTNEFATDIDESNEREMDSLRTCLKEAEKNLENVVQEATRQDTERIKEMKKMQHGMQQSVKEVKEMKEERKRMSLELKGCKEEMEIHQRRAEVVEKMSDKIRAEFASATLLSSASSEHVLSLSKKLEEKENDFQIAERTMLRQKNSLKEKIESIQQLKEHFEQYSCATEKEVEMASSRAAQMRRELSREFSFVSLCCFLVLFSFFLVSPLLRRTTVLDPDVSSFFFFFFFCQN